jgi:hypothetical protein
MPNIYSPTISHTGQTITPHKKKKKSITLHHVAILVPHNELVMKSYVHVQLAIVATHNNLNNIKIREYWLLTSNAGIKYKSTKLQHRTKEHMAIFPHFWHFQFAEQYKEHHNLVCTIILQTRKKS